MTVSSMVCTSLPRRSLNQVRQSTNSTLQPWYKEPHANAEAVRAGAQHSQPSACKGPQVDLYLDGCTPSWLVRAPLAKLAGV